MAGRLAPAHRGPRPRAGGRAVPRRSSRRPASCRDLVVRVGNQPGTGLTVRLGRSAHRAAQPLDEYTQKVLQRRGAGRVYPYELVPPADGRRRHASSSTTSTTTATLRARRPPARARTRPASSSASCARRRPATPRAWPGSPSSATPPRRSARIAEPECRRLLAAIDLADRAGRADRVVRPVGRGQDRHEQRQREPRLGRPGAAPPRRVHAGRRRGERRRGRHQRRRPALLERRGHDAHAHPRASSS